MCPRCGYVRVVKSGHAKGNQRWLCRRCGYQFTRTDGPPAGADTPETTKRAAVTLYGHGLSFRTVGKLLGTTAQSVLRWVVGYVDEHCAKPCPDVHRRGTVGSSKFCVDDRSVFHCLMFASGLTEDPSAQQLEAGPTIHRALDRLQPVDLTLVQKGGAGGGREGERV